MPRIFDTAAVNNGLSNGVLAVEVSTTGTPQMGLRQRRRSSHNAVGPDCLKSGDQALDVTRQRQSAISRDHPTETDVTIPPSTMRLTRESK